MSMRKILIPVAAGLLFSPALMAADLDGPSASRTNSSEFLGTAGAADIVLGDVLAVTLAAEYAIGDIITLTFSGSALDGTTVPTSITVVAGAINGITLGLLSADSDTAVYRVTDVVAGVANTTVGVVVPFAAAGVLEFDAQDVGTAGGVTVSYSAATDTGIPLDTGGGDLRSIDYLVVDDEYEVDVLPLFDQIVDVEQDREAFTVGIDDTGTTTLTNAVFFGETAFVDQDIVWSADFGWIIDTDSVIADIQPIAGVVTMAGCASIVVTATSISATCPAGAASLVLDPSVNTDVDGLRILPATSYTVTVTVNFTGFGGTAGSVTFSALAGGQWLLNGFQALLPYVPYGSGITQVIYLVNRGLQSGDITVEWVDQNGNTGTLGVIATLAATTVLSIGPTIQAALPTTQRTTGRLGLTITANVPANDVQINSQYNVNGNRAFIATDDNRP